MASDEHRAGDVAGADGVDEFRLRHRIEQQLPERSQLHAHGVGIEDGADRILHPAVGDQDPQRGQIGADRDQPGDRRWPSFGSRSQPKKNRPTKVDFEKECHQAFDRQRRAENVADIMRVIGPVGAELEFHGDAGGDPHGEIDAEQLAPESRHVAPDFPAGHDVDALHDGKQERQPERQRHEQEMVERRCGELQPRKDDGIKVEHVNVSLHLVTASKDLSAAKLRPDRRSAAR